MMKLLNSPNIPSSVVRLAAVAESAGECTKKLKEIDVDVLPVPPIREFRTSVKDHADLQILPFSEKSIFLTEHMFSLLSLKIAEAKLQTEDFDTKLLNTSLNEEYPADVPLNAVVIGKYLLCNPKTISASVLEASEQAGLKMIPVKQGYTKCSVCILNENAIITDDIGIYQSAQFFLNDVTYVPKNSIRLRGFDYGFIGGATGLIDKNVLAVNGSIESHDGHNDIIDALARNNIKAIELRQGPMEDIGSIIPIFEK